MTLPNKLTIGRIAAVPAMIVVECIPYLRDTAMFATGYGFMSIANFINIIIFVLAAFTDFLDGKIARKRNLVTTFGKFADPLADKMLVLISLMILMNQGKIVTVGIDFRLVPMWGLAIILIRELTISGIRLVAAQRGEVIAAGWAGKVKTFVTMIAIFVLFFGGLWKIVDFIGVILMYVSIFLTVYSGDIYMYNSRHLLFESM